jgi:hypothetical protein
MVKMYLIKFDGKSSNYFKNGETYVGRTGKDGAIYMFNDKGYWSLAINQQMTRANLIKPIDIEKVFYVNNHKEALSYPQIPKTNWGIDLKRIRDGEEFTFIRPAIRAYYGFDVIYTARMGALDTIHTSWDDPDTNKPVSYMEENAYDELIDMIKNGDWIITQKESV